MESSITDSELDCECDCPVCHNVLLPPIFQCFNGHLLCSECIDKMRECPVCHDDLPRRHIKALEIENLVRKSRRHCPFSNLGCKELFSKTDDNALEEHKIECNFGPLNYCQLLGLKCEEKFTEGDLVDHLTSAHKALLFSYDLGDELEVCKNECQAVREDQVAFETMCKNSNSNSTEGQPLPYFALIQENDKTYALKCLEYKKEGVISWEVLLIGTEKIPRNCDASIKLIPSDSSIADHTCSLKWKGKTSNLKTDEGSKKLGSTQTSFSITYKDFPTLFSFEEGTEKLQWKIMLKLEVAGAQGRRDTPAQSVVHKNVRCDGICNGSGSSSDSDSDSDSDLVSGWGIVGPRYKCLECFNYDLCQQCMKRKIHAHHVFAVIPRPEMISQLPMY